MRPGLLQEYCSIESMHMILNCKNNGVLRLLNNWKMASQLTSYSVLLFRLYRCIREPVIFICQYFDQPIDS